jgi:tetratricopeptide (TPR) repeat protein
MPDEGMRPEEAVRRVMKLPAPRRAPALRSMLQDQPRLLARALDLLPTDAGDAAWNARLLEAKPAAALPHVGPYTLRSVLGEGGFGVVWLATQSEPVQRSVALKILRPDRVGTPGAARFEAERQMLATLNHPNLVKVFDAGETADGRPWFTMELAQGAPITEAANAARLGLRDRIDLITQVARAVHHAHLHGLVHRDLKPANILLCFEGDQAQVKVIDFGVSHATYAPADPDQRAGSLVGTPDYLPPEQLRLKTTEPDVHADVFAMGVVLRRLLAGTDLGDRREGLVSALEALDRDLRISVAAERRETVASLRHQLQGDLDAIVWKCLADDPRHRYGSALELAQDLERHLRGEPVLAQGDSLAYRGMVAIRRNRLPLATAMLVLLVAATGFFWAMHERGLALAARDQAQVRARQVQQANAYVVELLTEIVTATARSRPATATAILLEASSLAGVRLAGDPEQEARVRTALGHLWLHLRAPEQADREFARAEQVHEMLGRAQPLQAVRVERAEALRMAGRLGEARDAATMALREAGALVPEDHDDVARALIELAYIDARAGNPIQARQSLDRAAELLRKAPANGMFTRAELDQAEKAIDSTIPAGR